MLRLMGNTIVLLLALAGSQVLARGPTQVDPQTIETDKQLLAACAKMEEAVKTMLAASQRLVGGGDLDAARRDLVKGDALMRDGDTEMADGIRRQTAEGAMMDSSKLMSDARQMLMEGRAELMSAVEQVSAPKQIEAARPAIQEARQTMRRGDEKMQTARNMMWSRMQMAK